MRSFKNVFVDRSFLHFLYCYLTNKVFVFYCIVATSVCFLLYYNTYFTKTNSCQVSLDRSFD